MLKGKALQSRRGGYVSPPQKDPQRTEGCRFSMWPNFVPRKPWTGTGYSIVSVALAFTAASLSARIDLRCFWPCRLRA